MPTSILIPDSIIENRIYQVLDKKIMLDRDLAEMYGVETSQLKRQVKRNLDRFPEDFMFERSKEELQNWRSQFGISNEDRMGLRYAPFCFTEQGVSMLSSDLSSKTAIAVNIQIIRIFTRLREIAFANKDILLLLEKMDKKILNVSHDVKMHDDEIVTIFELIDEMREKKALLAPPKNPIGFNTKSSKNN